MTPADAATLKACADEVADRRAAMDGKWGAGRLFALVGLELREKFERQERKWLDALEAAYAGKVVAAVELQAVRDRAQAMVRAFAALDAAAEASGAQRLSPDVWEGVLADGTVIAVCRTNADAAAVTRSGRAMTAWTVQEFANAISAMPSLLDDAKKYFPGATILPPRQPKFVPDLEIPF